MDHDRLVMAMVGREITQMFKRKIERLVKRFSELKGWDAKVSLKMSHSLSVKGDFSFNGSGRCGRTEV